MESTFLHNGMEYSRIMLKIYFPHTICPNYNARCSSRWSGESGLFCSAWIWVIYPWFISQIILNIHHCTPSQLSITSKFKQSLTGITLCWLISYLSSLPLSLNSNSKQINRDKAIRSIDLLNSVNYHNFFPFYITALGMFMYLVTKHCQHN